MAAVDAPAPPAEPDADEVSLTVDGTEWWVSVLGRSAGPGATGAPLLLLGFSTGSGPNRDMRREVMTVGKTLEALTPPALEAAFSASTEPRARQPRGREDGGSRRRTGRGGATRSRRD